MQINSYTIKVGDYVRCILPKRQRIAPCKVERIEHGCVFVVTPLAKTGRGIHHYHIPITSIHSIIDPKEVQQK